MLLVQAFCFLLVLESIRGNIIYVSTEGVIDDCGSIDKPCQSITDALNQNTYPNITIKVNSGTYKYDKNLNIVFPLLSNIRIENLTPDEEVLFDCGFSFNTFAFRAQSNLELHGISISNCSSGILFSPSLPNQSLSLEDVLITQCSRAIVSQGGSVQLERSEISHCGQLGEEKGGLLIEDSPYDDISVEYIIISNSYFEDIPKNAVDINTAVNQIILVDTEFRELPGIYLNGGATCDGEILRCSFTHVMQHLSSSCLQIEEGTWSLQNMLIETEDDQLIGLGIFVSRVEISLDQIDARIGATSLYAMNSNIDIAGSSFMAAEKGIVVEITDSDEYSFEMHDSHTQASMHSVNIIDYTDNSSPHSVSITNCEFSKTGGIYINATCQGIVESCSFTEIQSGHTLTLDKGEWNFNNISVIESGGWFLTGKEMQATIQNSIFQNNSALNGGAIYFDGDQLSLLDCVFEGNIAGLYGGAVYQGENSVVIISSSSFLSNEAYEGAVVFCEISSSSAVQLDGTILENNFNSVGAEISCQQTTDQLVDTLLWLRILLFVLPLVVFATFTSLMVCFLLCCCCRKQNKNLSITDSHVFFTLYNI